MPQKKRNLVWGCPHDVSFSQDVIARHAELEWYPEAYAPIPLSELIPPRWSRRRPAAKDDLKSVVYLCCPVQSQETWAFLTAITTFKKGDWDENPAMRLLPVRQLDFNNTETAQIFEETHNLANWFVNYDELLDRRQLQNQGVRIRRRCNRKRSSSDHAIADPRNATVEKRVPSVCPLHQLN